MPCRIGVRAFLSLRCALAAVALLAAAPADAHELGTVQVHASFQHDGCWRVEVNVDPEHLPAATPTERGEAGTTRALEAALADLPPGVEPRLAGFLRAYLASAELAFDGRPVRPETAVVVPYTVSPGGSPQTTLRLGGTLPAGVSSFTWRAGLDVGPYPFSAASEGDESPLYQWLTAGQQSEPVPLGQAVVPPTISETVQRYLGLGFTHIVPLGTDHVLFVLGIFLLAAGEPRGRRLRPMLLQVSAFTVAHTLTLGLTLYGLVALPARVVEPAIALSIVYVAVENVLTRRLHARRLGLVFGFGLLHGMGFAGVLGELGLPRARFLPALVGFNAGVELGQLAVIATAFAGLALLARDGAGDRRRLAVPASIAIAAVGLFWAVQRIFF